jgi:hypothetical protein
VIGVDGFKDDVPVLVVPLVEAGLDKANGKALLLRE